MEQTADYVIAGAGSAGCVLARLAEMEDWEGGASDLRGVGGPVKVTRQKDLTGASQAFVAVLLSMPEASRHD
jgi:hypothetical protein